MLVWVLGGLVSCWVLVVAGMLARNAPPLFDPPGPARRLATYLFSNTAQTSADSVFPELRSRRFALSAQRMLPLLAAAARDAGLEQVRTDESAGAVEAVAVTALGFRDDVRLRVISDGDGSVVDAISSSRMGRGDLGANQRHLREVFAALQTRAVEAAAR